MTAPGDTRGAQILRVVTAEVRIELRATAEAGPAHASAEAMAGADREAPL